MELDEMKVELLKALKREAIEYILEGIGSDFQLDLEYSSIEEVDDAWEMLKNVSMAKNFHELQLAWEEYHPDSSIFDFVRD